jgi:hypothetical protein
MRVRLLLLALSTIIGLPLQTGQAGYGFSARLTTNNFFTWGKREDQEVLEYRRSRSHNERWLVRDLRPLVNSVRQRRTARWLGTRTEH